MLELLPELPAGVTTGIRVGATLCGAAFALFQFSLVVWTWRDMSARTRDGWLKVLAVLLVLFTSVFGLVIYLLLRPRETLSEHYERELVEEILARELSAAALKRNESRIARREQAVTQRTIDPGT